MSWWGPEYVATVDEVALTELPPAVRLMADMARGLTPADMYRTMTETRPRIAAEYARVFSAFDVLVTPTMPLTAFPHPGELAGAREIDGVEVPIPALYFHRMTEPPSHVGLPALSLPCGFDSDGLPVGLQIIGTYHDDATVLRDGVRLRGRDPVARAAPGMSERVAFADLPSLQGRTFTGRPFQVTRAERDGFEHLTWVDQAYTDPDPPEFPADIVEGFHSLALLDAVATMVQSVDPATAYGYNYGLDRVRFTAPILIGDTVLSSFEVAEVRAKGRGGSCSGAAPSPSRGPTGRRSWPTGGCSTCHARVGSSLGRARGQVVVGGPPDEDARHRGRRAQGRSRHDQRGGRQAGARGAAG